MALLDRQTLQQIGIELREDDYALLEDHFATTLQERVIDEVVDELSVDQAQELATLRGSDDQALLGWLQENVSDFQQIVADEIDILMGELADNSDAITDAP